MSFLISRYLARDRMTRLLNRHERFDAIDRAVGENGAKIVALLRLSPVFPFLLLNYGLGLTAVRFPTYVLASWIGMMPGTFLYVYLGVAGRAGLEATGGSGRSPLEWAMFVIGLLATIAVTVVVTRIARNALKSEALDASPASPAS